MLVACAHVLDTGSDHMSRLRYLTPVSASEPLEYTILLEKRRLEDKSTWHWLKYQIRRKPGMG